jgi:predicted enzyme related to lactoylglutathione lyase
MPLDGWDHVELWVGNAKQAAFHYEHAFGFTTTAYAGPETGVRDRASYLLEQGEVRLVVTSGLREDSEVARFASKHGDGAQDIALRVPDAKEAYRQTVQRGARGIAEPRWVEDEFGRVELATIGTYGDVVHTFVNRSEYEGPYLPGYVALPSQNGSARRGVGLLNIDHVVCNVELGRMQHWVEFYERAFGFAPSRVTVSTVGVVDKLEAFFRACRLFGLCACLDRFGGRRGIARRFIFENENHIFLRCFFCSVAQFFIHGRAIRCLILEAPKIEKADAVGIENLGQLDAALEHFILLFERKVGVELIALRTELRWGRPRPVDLE